jgi:predicted TPR repeat methyltransferase
MKQTRKLSVEDAMLMAIELNKRGLLEEARSIYDDVLRADPENRDATHFLGVVSHQLGDSERGLEHMMRALELDPDQPSILNNLGNIYKEIGRLEEAQEMYQRVLDIAPGHADTWVNLGVILRELRQPEAALERLNRALELNPEHPDAYFNLGDTYRDLKRSDDAFAAYLKSGELTAGQSKTPRAIASLQYALGRKEQAVWTLRAWIERQPDDAAAKHLLAAYSGENIPARASDDYVRQCFDGFAKSFDEVLKRLDYKAPKLVGECAKRLVPKSGQFRQILDIGCGTGLCGQYLKPLGSSLTGVDLSRGMLTKARTTKLYDELLEAELTQYMLKTPDRFDLVTCADTFVYFGELKGAFEASSVTLTDRGYLIFTVEQHTTDENPEDFWLRHHGRYSHTKEHLARLLPACGLEVEIMDEVNLRKEGGQPVSGLLIAARKQ